MGGLNLDQPYALAISDAGNIYVAGLFSGIADFDPGPLLYNLTAAGPDDAFIVELDNSGNFLWAYGLGGPDEDFARGINIYGASDVYICGVFSYAADFNPGPPFYNLVSYLNTPDAFLLKLRFCTPTTTVVTYKLCPGDSVFVAGAYQHFPGNYYDYYTSTTGCDSVVVTNVIYLYTLNMGSDLNACNGEIVQLNAGVDLASYLWNTGDTTQTIFVSSTNDYSVRVTKTDARSVILFM